VKCPHLHPVVVVLFASLGWAVALGAVPSAPAESPPRAAVISARQIEADWLRQEMVRTLAATPVPRPMPAKTTVTTQEDAAGGCDGIKNGRYGFHTNTDTEPWWQVDLGRSQSLARVVVYNRCDGSVEGRASQLKVLLSDDGKSWTELYQHDGTIFRGQSDGKPLSVPAGGAKARYVRIQLRRRLYRQVLHLDEIEVYGTGAGENLALHRPAEQSSTSPWSTRHVAATGPETASSGGEKSEPRPTWPSAKVVAGGLKLAEELGTLGAGVDRQVAVLREVARRLGQLPAEAPQGVRRELYFKARWAVRKMALANPLLDFDDLLLVKRVPGTFTHMSDQYYGWFSRPGGGLYILKGFKTNSPRLRCLTGGFAPGSVIRPDISYDGKRVLFAHCKYYPGLREEENKLDKANVPEDAFYHLYEMNLDGTGIRRLTRGKYDNFDGRYLPDGRIVFLSTRRGQYVQCNRATAALSIDGQLPDSYVRCGGGPERPVAIYTLHVMDADGSSLMQISPFENFEWTPSVDNHGRILYARWDYIDRYNMPYMSLWSTMPDGTSAQAVFGNFTTNPHCIFEARAIPNSRKLVFTASGHHANTGGCLVLLDTSRGIDGEEPMKRLTPEVVFPESEGWPKSYFANPYPLSENHYLVAWSDKEMIGWPGPSEPVNAMGVYLLDAFGNLNLIYRDEAISSTHPIPIRRRKRPPQISSLVDWDGPQEARMLLLDVYEGLETIEPGTIRRLRIVGIPAKDHPTMNSPVMGLTRDDPGKFVIGTVPVEADGSAFFRVPSGVSFFLQAIDAGGQAVQTMRSVTYVQPGQTYTCIGCHERRNTSPPNAYPAAARRQPSKITPGPAGSWPLSFQALVQPVIETRCVRCHKPGEEGEKLDLTAAKSYDSLVDYGKPSLRTHVLARYREGRSTAGACAARVSPLLKLISKDHYDVKLTADDTQRLITWMDTYAQRLGSFSKEQEQQLRDLRQRMAPMLEN